MLLVTFFQDGILLEKISAKNAPQINPNIVQCRSDATNIKEGAAEKWHETISRMLCSAALVCECKVRH